MQPRNRRLAAMLLGTVIGLGCGSDDSSSTGAGAAATDGGAGAGASSTGAGATGSDAGGAGASGGVGAAGGDGGAPSCSLAEVDPIVVTRNGQVIENVRIASTRGAAITVEGFSGVVIKNVLIEHQNGPGIEVSNADDLLIENVSIEHTGAPASGANPSDELLNILCYASANLSVENARLTRGSSGIYLLECPNASLHFLEGHDIRGPFPRGQLVQWNNSDGGVLEDFYVENPATSWPEDNVNVFQSVDMQIRRGLIDGNNSPSGVGVIFDGDEALGIVEDVDAIRMGNGCFSDYAGSDGVVFRRTRCRENICTDQGRGVPLSGALMFGGHPGFTQIRLEESSYFAACNPDNIVWPTESFAVLELVEEDFQLRAPIVLDFCWE